MTSEIPSTVANFCPIFEVCLSTLATRMLLPAAISAAGVVATQMWYLEASKIAPIKGSGPPVAILEFQQDQVERRPAARLIWQDLAQGDQLYSGETVRTTSSASGRIRFSASGIVVGLEPDSVVTIEESNGQLALNLVNGGVFVKNDASETPKKGANQPLIKAGTKTLSLSDRKSEMNLSLSDTGQANVVVAKGNVTLASTSGQAQTIKEGSVTSLSTSGAAITPIELIGAAPNATIVISAASSTMPIRWKPLDATVLIQAEISATRDGLRPTGQLMPGSSGSGKLEIKPGGFFWRLVGRDKAGKLTASSVTVFNQSLAVEAPRLLSYASGEQQFVKAGSEAPAVSLSWSRPTGSEATLLEVSRADDFKTILHTKKFTTETEWSLPGKDAGQYFWRVSASWRGVERPMTSKIGHFVINQQKELPSPTLESPTEGSTFAKDQLQKSGLTLSWTAAQGIEQFEVLVQMQQSGGTWKDLPTVKTTVTQYRLPPLPAGSWRWSARTADGTQLSKPAPWWSFKVTEVARLDASSFAGSSQILALDNLVKLKLTGVPRSAGRLRFRVATSEAGLSGAVWQQGLLTGELVFKVKTPTTLVLTAEALDGSDRVMAKLEPTSFETRLPERLPPPVLVGNAAKIQASASGSATLAWTPVAGAAKYAVTVVGKQKVLLKKEYAPGQKPSLAGLPPGTHKVTITPIDHFGRPGTASQEFTLSVPEVSDVAAPTAKKGLRVH